MRFSTFALVPVILLLSCACVGAATELMPNADLKTTDGWVGTSGAAGTMPRVIEIQQIDGRNALHFACDRDSKVLQEWPGSGVVTPQFATETGKTYHISLKAKVPVGSVAMTVTGGAASWSRTLAQFGAYAANDLPKGWESCDLEFTETAGGPGARVGFVSFGGGSVDCYLADLSVIEVDRSPTAIATAWKAAFPGKSYACWQKSPWDNTLTTTSMPPAKVQEVEKIRVAMGRTEYESASFVITNISDSPAECTLKVQCPGVQVTTREGVWVKQHDGTTVCDALVLREDGKISIPAMGNREAWFTLKTTNTQPGSYRGRVVVSTAGQPEKTIPIEVKVYPVTLPDEKPLYTCFWDYIVAKTPGDSRAAAFAADMRDHYVTVACMPQIFVMKVKDGKVEPTDYTVFDLTVKNYQKIMRPKFFLFFWGTEGNFEPITEPKFLSDEWKTLFKQFLGDWITHIKSLGIGYDQFAMYPYDEHINDSAPQLAKLIREVDPKVLFYADAMGQKTQEIHAMQQYMDIWCPFLYDYLNRAPYDRQYEIKAEAKKVFGKGRRPERFWTYANPPGSTGPGIAPPYRDYRLSAWRAWQLGMGGFGIWCYTYYLQTLNGGPMYWDPGGPNWQLVYASNAVDAPTGLPKGELVIPSRRWEATREGIEDYCYLWMLKQAVSKHAQPDYSAARSALEDLPSELLQYPDQLWRADREKENLLKLLAGK